MQFKATAYNNFCGGVDDNPQMQKRERVSHKWNPTANCPQSQRFEPQRCSKKQWCKWTARLSKGKSSLPLSSQQSTDARARKRAKAKHCP
eukprot:6178065-Pleurochrysis_carterae.AAC.2